MTPAASASVRRCAYLELWSSAHGGRDPRSSRLVLGWLTVVHRAARPLVTRRVPPGCITLVGVLCAVASVVPAAAGNGGELAGVPLVLLAALCDGLDGAVAVMTGTASARGRVLDQLADRVGEVAFLVCLWSIGAPGPVCLAVGALTVLQETLRERATRAGRRGLPLTPWERPTRVVLTIMALGASGAAALSGVDLGPVGPGSGALGLLLAVTGVVWLSTSLLVRGCGRRGSAGRVGGSDEVGDDPARQRDQGEPAAGMGGTADEEEPGDR